MIIDRSMPRLEFFRGLYDAARAASEETFKAMERSMAQYNGDPSIDGSDVPASMVRNITYELIESQVTGYLPSPSVTPAVWSERGDRCAKAIETLLRNKRNELPFEKQNDLDERLCPIYGGSVWLIEWDDSIVTHDTVGDVKVTCISPTDFVGQPYVSDIDDMEYCFIRFETTKEDIVRRYGVSVATADETVSDDADDQTATLVVCYYRDDAGKICQYVWSGETELLDLGDYYARKRYTCKVCGKRKELCECQHAEFVAQNEEVETLTRDVRRSDGSILPAESVVIRDGEVATRIGQAQALTHDGRVALDGSADGVLLPIAADVLTPLMEPTKIPFFQPNVFPVVIRKNNSREGSLYGQSDCAVIRQQQQAINKLESRIMRKMMRSGVYATVPASFQGDVDNTIFANVFRVTQADHNLFGRIDLSADITNDVVQSERLYDQAKRILGITDSYQGQPDRTAASGRAKQIQVAQAAGRLSSKRIMKNAAYAEMDKIIFQYYLAYADEPRMAAYQDETGALQYAAFNRYDFVERDQSGAFFYNDQFLFAADNSVDVDSDRGALWQENRLNFQQGAYGNPSDPEALLIFWLNMEKAHYPWARDNVERIRGMLARRREEAQQQQELNAMRDELRNRSEYEHYLISHIAEPARDRGAEGGTDEDQQQR